MKKFSHTHVAIASLSLAVFLTAIGGMRGSLNAQIGGSYWQVNVLCKLLGYCNFAAAGTSTTGKTQPVGGTQTTGGGGTQITGGTSAGQGNAGFNPTPNTGAPVGGGTQGTNGASEGQGNWWSPTPPPVQPDPTLHQGAPANGDAFELLPPPTPDFSQSAGAGNAGNGNFCSVQNVNPGEGLEGCPNPFEEAGTCAGDKLLQQCADGSYALIGCEHGCSNGVCSKPESDSSGDSGGSNTDGSANGDGNQGGGSTSTGNDGNGSGSGNGSSVVNMCQWNGVASMDFSNDGRWLVFSSMSDKITQGGNEQGNQLYLYDTVNHQTQALTDPNGTGGLPYEGVDGIISGNGKFVAFDGMSVPGNNAERRIMLLNLDTRSYKEISTGYVFGGPGGISDDGRYILYKENCLNLYDTQTESTVLIAGLTKDINGNHIDNCTRFTRNPKSADPLIGNIYTHIAAISGDGKTVVFWASDPGPMNDGYWYTQQDQTFSLYTYDVASGAKPVRLGAFDGNGFTLSQDGKMMYYTKDRSSFKQSTDLTGTAQLIYPGNGAVSDVVLFYSATNDMRKISFQGGKGGLHILVYDGTATVDVSEAHGSIAYAPLSPDGRLISFANQASDSYTFRGSIMKKDSLFVRDLSGGSKATVPQPGASCQ